jgi:hypothetical protein
MATEATIHSTKRIVLTSRSPAELGARLTCLTLLFSPVGDWYIQPFVMCLSAAGLLFAHWWRSRWLWLALALLTVTRALVDWPLADNHAYLLGYWCVALAIAFWFDDFTGLKRNARWLIGLAFALAAWQKWTSPDYRNDVFFLTTFLLDDRFEDFVVLLTSLTYEQIDLARDYLEGDYRTVTPGPLPLQFPASMLLLARLSMLWNLFEQTLVALAFLLPPGSRLGRLSDAILLLFCFTIYAVAPVVSFGWLLLAMGISRPNRRSGCVSPISRPSPCWCFTTRYPGQGYWCSILDWSSHP